MDPIKIELHQDPMLTITVDKPSYNVITITQIDPNNEEMMDVIGIERDKVPELIEALQNIINQ